MLIIKNNTNNHVFTLQERSEIVSTGGTPFYLFHLQFEQDNGDTEKFFVSSGQTNNQRYNQFTITESGSTEYFTGSTISLNLTEGQWKYTAYEQVSNSNLNPALAYKQLETGRIVVLGSTNNTPYYFN